MCCRMNVRLAFVVVILSSRLVNGDDAGLLSCGKHFDIVNNSCYLFKKVVYSWDNAHRYCSSLGGELPHLDKNSFSTLKKIKNVLWNGVRSWSRLRPSRDMQTTGMEAKELEKFREEYQWDSCLAFDIYKNVTMWFACSSRLPFICKREKWHYRGKCPEKFIPIGEKCYRVFGKVKDLKTKDEAIESCKRLDGVVNGRLAAISASVELSALLLSTKHESVDLRLMINSGIYALGSSTSLRAGISLMFPASALVPGKIRKNNNLEAGYVCMSDRLNIGSVPKRQSTRAGFSNEWTRGECDSGFESFGPDGRICYQKVNTRSTLDDAEKYCKERSGNGQSHVASVTNEFEQALAHLLRVELREDMWLGCETGRCGSDPIQWLDGRLALFKVMETSSGCISMKFDGRWNIVDCTIRLPFVCAYSRVPLQISILNTEDCPTTDSTAFSTARFEERCFHLSHTRINFSASSQKCPEQSTLVDIKSRRLTRFLIHWLLGNPLTHKSVKIWLPQNATKAGEYQNWRSYADMTSKKGCSALDENGQWVAADCKEKLFFICEAPLSATKSEEGLTTPTNKDEPKKSLKEMIQEIVIIVVALFFVFTLIALIILKFKRRNPSQPPDPEEQNRNELPDMRSRPVPPPKQFPEMTGISDEGVFEDVYSDMDDPEELPGDY